MAGHPRRPTPGPEPRPPLTRERVLRAALVLADERGLDALSMRRLGRRLGVEAMSLYNHIRNKEDLLDGIVDLVVNEIDLPSGDVDWREAMRRRAVSARGAFERHPWASALIDSRQSSGPGRLHYLEWMIGTLRRAGFSVEMALRAVSVIDSYVYGFGRQQVNMSADESDVAPEATAEAFLSAIPADAFPFLREVTEHQMRVGYDDSADFEFGLGLILDGLERARAASPA